MLNKSKILHLLCGLFATTVIASCGSNGDSNTSSCIETGPYACKTGATEPLYEFQWALNAVASYFKNFPLVADGSTDLNVEEVHTQGIKGRGINVMVVDDGLEIRHEDLEANVNTSMTWNFLNSSTDPTPLDPDDAHGTNVGGIIAAAQNGKGIMGVVPLANLGGANWLLSMTIENTLLAYGGADWSKYTDVFNASYGANPRGPTNYQPNIALQSITNLRGGRGAVTVKAAGNEFNQVSYAPRCPTLTTPNNLSCDNPVNDTETLELPVIVTGAVNPMGYKSSYSSAGSVLWITGLSGQNESSGNYGEFGKALDAQGPKIYATDLMGCDRGFSANGKTEVPQFMIGETYIQKERNPNCNYDQMGGTSSATPTVTGVIALMLSANRNLGWRDIRDILRRTARKVDPDYGNQLSRNRQVTLTNPPELGSITQVPGADLVDGGMAARLDYGWQTNKAGNKYSTWYGWGLVDAGKAVAMAKTYTEYKPTTLIVPEWKSGIEGGLVSYGSIKKLGEFVVSENVSVDMIQLKLTAGSATPVCMGSVGLVLKSPQGSFSILSRPYNFWWNFDSEGKLTNQQGYVQGSYAFYGESSKGTWTVYAVNGTPRGPDEDWKPVVCPANPTLNVMYRIYDAT